jgi:hypothetical protein
VRVSELPDAPPAVEVRRRIRVKAVAHLIGLEDEHDRPAQDPQGVTGEGHLCRRAVMTSPTRSVARGTSDSRSFGDGSEQRRAERATAIVGTDFGNKIRAFQLAQAYQALFAPRKPAADKFGIVLDRILEGIHARLPEKVRPPAADRETLLGIFTFTSKSIMGHESALGARVEPRHVQEFVDALKLRRGPWEAVERFRRAR